MWYLKRNYRYAKVNYKCGIQPYLTCTLRCKTRFQYKAAATDFSNPSLALALFSTIKTIKEKKLRTCLPCCNRKNNAIVFNPFSMHAHAVTEP